MKPLNYFLIFAAALTLTACPYLDPPPPVAPLASPKTHKTSFKAGCRLKKGYEDANNGYTYDAEGKLLLQRNLRNEFGYEYDANGFLIKQYVLYGIVLVFPNGHTSTMPTET